MNHDLEEKLFEKYKHILDVPAIRRDTGIRTGNGWYDFLDESLQEISDFIKKFPAIKLKIACIKEKWGGLRMYADEIIVSVEFFELINKIEAKSISICEACGESNASLTTMGWIHALCPPCKEKTIKSTLPDLEKFWDQLPKSMREKDEKTN